MQSAHWICKSELKEFYSAVSELPGAEMVIRQIKLSVILTWHQWSLYQYKNTI